MLAKVQPIPRSTIDAFAVIIASRARRTAAERSADGGQFAQIARIRFSVAARMAEICSMPSASG